jgi:hypothetical protein
VKDEYWIAIGGIAFVAIIVIAPHLHKTAQGASPVPAKKPVPIKLPRAPSKPTPAVTATPKIQDALWQFNPDPKGPIWGLPMGNYSNPQIA